MKEIRTEIEIAAPVEKVWEILTDFEKWGEWNPIVAHISGKAAPGEHLQVTMSAPGGKKGKSYKAVLLNAAEPMSLSWRAFMITGFIFTNDKVFELEEVGKATRLIHIEAFKGILLPLFWDKLNEFVPAMLNTMNEALKSAAENG